MHQTHIRPTPQIEPKTDRIACSAGCKRETADPEKVGWEFLPISRRWRCPWCTKELDVTNGSWMAERRAAGDSD